MEVGRTVKTVSRFDSGRWKPFYPFSKSRASSARDLTCGFKAPAQTTTEAQRSDDTPQKTARKCPTKSVQATAAVAARRAIVGFPSVRLHLGFMLHQLWLTSAVDAQCTP